MNTPHISLVADIIGHLGPLPISNSLLTTWLVIGLVFIFSKVVTRNLSIIPTNIQSIGEAVIEGLEGLFKGILGPDNTRKFFPLLATFFIFIIASNWSGLIPGVGSIGLREESKLIPIFRAPTADLNTTIALALISVLLIQFFGILALRSHHFKKYFNFSSPIMFFVGLLEIISEISRIISFAFRLFGNIFAGEVLLTVIAFLIPVIVPIPFLGLELFVGFIQALVFSMLTATFLQLAITKEVSSH